MPMIPPDALPESLTPAIRQATREAGAMALRFFRSGQTTSARIWSKAGGSPVTEADVAVDSFLKTRLADVLPQAGWLSEETEDDPGRLHRDLVWIVDPIDGTRAFLSGSPDWAVVVALLAEGRPALGFVYAPVPRTLYEARQGTGARRNGEPVSVSAADELHGTRVAGPKPLVDALERRVGPIERIPRVPSLALRLVRVADGSIDVGLVSGNAHDWDIAAADLILHEAGGRLTDLAGKPLRYNGPEPVHGELAASSGRLHPRLIEAMRAHSQRAPARR